MNYEKLDQIVASYRDELIANIQKWVSVPSVKADAAGDFQDLRWMRSSGDSHMLQVSVRVGAVPVESRVVVSVRGEVL